VSRDSFICGASLAAGSDTNICVEIYTPIQPTAIELFYEAIDYLNTAGGATIASVTGTQAARYAITDAGTVSRVFSKTSGSLLGDVTKDAGSEEYERDTAYGYSGYSNTDPYSNTRTTQAYGVYFTMNPFSKYFEIWNHCVGIRTLAISLVDTEAVSKYNYVRYSNPYVQGSLVNGLNTFDALDEYQLPVESGTGIILTDRGDNLLALFESETVSIYVGEGFVNTTNDNNFLTKTESVIGDDRKLQGNFGTQHPASVAHNGGRTYYLDARRGSVIRCSQDGLTGSDYPSGKVKEGNGYLVNSPMLE